MTRKRHGGAIRAAAALLLGAGTAAGPESFEITLWANDDSVERIANVVATSAHPCGTVARVRVTTMPPHVQPEGPLAPDLVAEVGSGGARWSVPVDSVPIAVDGTALLTKHGEDGRLWIETDGSIRRGSAGESHPRGIGRDCPAPMVQRESDYGMCLELVDRGTGRTRKFEYEAPCT